MATVSRLSIGFKRFFKTEAASGILLATAALVALIIANTSYASAFKAIWDTRLVVGIGSFSLDYPVWYWINDALMAIFFFVIGLEIKREIVHGELSQPRKVALPLIAAVGGALFPALIYLALDPLAGSARTGWAIPMATDIAFVVGVLGLLGKRVPPGLRVFLLSLAIADDLIAVLVIAVFYTSGLNLIALALAALGLIAVVAANRLGVRSVSVYAILGALVWLAFLKSGVHPTVAGVALGLLTPAKSLVDNASLRQTLREMLSHIETSSGAGSDHKRRETEQLLRESASPLHRIEHALHPWVAFGIMPLFALVNAGVALSFEGLVNELSLAVSAGLVFGKPLGIALFVFVAVKSGLAGLPKNVTVRHIIGGGALAGIGFTMALFIANLGLSGAMLETAKSGIVLGSVISAAVGIGILVWPARSGGD